MIKGLFFHDGPLLKDETGQYFGGGYNNRVFSKYYTIVDELTVGMRIEYISSEQTSGTKSPITLPRFHVVECPNISSVTGLLKRKKLRGILHKEILKTDCIIVRLPSMIGYMAIDVAKKIGKPYIVEVVACPWDSLWNHSLKGKLVAPFSTVALKKYVNASPWVIYVTESFLQNRYPTKGRNIDCSDATLSASNDEIMESRISRITQNRDKLIIGTTAAIDVKFKGQRYVIEALGLLKSKGITNFEYQLVGGGSADYLRSVAIKNDVLDQVKFMGSLPHDKVFQWLDDIDIYAQPSRQEGLPRSVVEAMSRGLPAFGARTGGIPELLEEQFIFSNSRNNVREICEIISNYTEETMTKQAMFNYVKSKEFCEEKLEAKRNIFFQEFKDKL